MLGHFLKYPLGVKKKKKDLSILLVLLTPNIIFKKITKHFFLTGHKKS